MFAIRRWRNTSELEHTLTHTGGVQVGSIVSVCVCALSSVHIRKHQAVRAAPSRVQPRVLPLCGGVAVCCSLFGYSYWSAKVPGWIAHVVNYDAARICISPPTSPCLGSLIIDGIR